MVFGWSMVPWLTGGRGPVHLWMLRAVVLIYLTVNRPALWPTKILMSQDQCGMNLWSFSVISGSHRCVACSRNATRHRLFSCAAGIFRCYWPRLAMNQWDWSKTSWNEEEKRIGDIHSTDKSSWSMWILLRFFSEVNSFSFCEKAPMQSIYFLLNDQWKESVGSFAVLWPPISGTLWVACSSES